MTAAANTPAHAGGRTGATVELARYTIPGGERILYGERVDGVAILVDVPASDEGRVYLVERDLDQDGHAALKALIAEYIAQAAVLMSVPMSASLLKRSLDRLEANAEVPS
jgi:hypothetical protein